MSEVDIEAGTQWHEALKASLDVCSFGVLCLTPENLTSRWMLFEAGYLAKAITGARVVPYLFDLRPADVPFPLAQFQAAEATLSGTIKLIHSLNETAALQLSRNHIERSCSQWWPELQSQLEQIPMPVAPTLEVDPPLRNDRALLEELVLQVRNLNQRVEAGSGNATRTTYAAPTPAPAETARPEPPIAMPWPKPLWNFTDDDLAGMDEADLRRFVFDANAILSEPTSHELDQLLGGRVARAHHILIAKRSHAASQP